MDQRVASASSPSRIFRAIAIPLAVLGLAYGLWKISDTLIWIGPFDRATFGWLVVVPLWLAAPIVAGAAWRSLPGPVVRFAAAVLTLFLASASGWLFWKAVAFPACDFGSNVTPEDMVVPAGLVGLVLGAGIAAAGLITRLGLRRYAWPRAVGIGLSATVVAFVVTYFIAVAAFGDLGCRRPPIV